MLYLLAFHIFIAGMHAWFAAAADTRYSVVVPIIGVQVVHPNDHTLDLVLVQLIICDMIAVFSMGHR